MNKASLKKRLLAYFIDFIIFSFVVTLISIILPVSNKQVELNDRLIEVEEKYIDGDIKLDEYINEYKEIMPEYDKENMALNICNLVFILGYFIVIPVINDGQTIGKKIVKIKIVKEEGILNTRDMIIRNFITTSLLQLMLSSTLVYLVNKDIYFITSIIVSLLQILLVILTTFMIIYRKDKNGVQDLITKTSVVEVEK